MTTTGDPFVTAAARAASKLPGVLPRLALSGRAGTGAWSGSVVSQISTPKHSSSSITVENLIQIMGSPEHAREVIAEADLTGDGVITYAEFKQLMTAQSATPRHLGAASVADEKAAPEGKEEGKRVAFA